VLTQRIVDAASISSALISHGLRPATPQAGYRCSSILLHASQQQHSFSSLLRREWARHNQPSTPIN